MDRVLVGTGPLTKQMVNVVPVTILDGTMRKSADLIVERPPKDGKRSSFFHNHPIMPIALNLKQLIVVHIFQVSHPSFLAKPNWESVGCV